MTNQPTREPTTQEIEERAEALLQHDVFRCQSHLVDGLLKLSGESFALDDNRELADAFGIDEIENLYPDPSDWTMEQCREYVDDYGIEYADPDPWSMNAETCAEWLESTGHAADESEPIETLRQAIIDSMDAEDIDGLDEWRDAVRDSAEPQEVFEWWPVSQFLCEELRAIGQPVIDNGYGLWWGRTCTGQTILMDGTLQAIARKMLTR
ncbi:MAG: hypothetical protein DWQ46_18220 [Planctomycetota bacterium]|nr:MAG: hypothetical protein DWQ46_18220 [Planctomycetota bacterium]